MSIIKFHLEFAVVTTMRSTPSSTQSGIVTCPPSTVMCGDGTCVSHVAFCERHPGICTFNLFLGIIDY